LRGRRWWWEIIAAHDIPRIIEAVVWMKSKR
jgi:hypothetical protein